MILIICSADPLKKSPEIQVSSTSCGSLHDAKIGQHWEGKVLAKLGRGDKAKKKSEKNVSTLLCTLQAGEG